MKRTTKDLKEFIRRNAMPQRNFSTTIEPNAKTMLEHAQEALHQDNSGKGVTPEYNEAKRKMDAIVKHNVQGGRQ